MSETIESFVADYEAWLREQSLAELAPRDEVLAVRDELRADEAFWTEQRPRFEELWARGEARLRKEERSLRDLLSEKSVERLLEGAERLEPDPEAVKTFLHSPAIETMLGSILYSGIFEFIKKVDLIGNIVNRLPVIGGIRKRVMGAFKEEIDNRLESQVKGFLGGFSGKAVERMVDFVLSEENQPGFRKARRRVAEHMLGRPVKSLVPAQEVTDRLRENLWTALRESGVKDETQLLDQAYESHGETALGEWVWKLTPAGRKLLAAPLERFLASSAWSLSQG